VLIVKLSVPVLRLMAGNRCLLAVHATTILILVAATAIAIHDQRRTLESIELHRQESECLSPQKGGALLIAGGRANDVIYDTFFRLAGGVDAKIVVIPTGRPKEGESYHQRLLKPWIARNPNQPAVILNAVSREQANDNEFIRVLDTATGVWIAGGSQTSLSNMYAGTAVEDRLRKVMKAGGIVAGTSAGAAVMSAVMIAHGKETAVLGQGFGLIPGVVIDQHFLRRNRMGRLAGVIEKRPDLVGIGIDEKTAIVYFPGNQQIRVVGESMVATIASRGPSMSPRINFLDSENWTTMNMLTEAPFETFNLSEATVTNE
jgi:cyanophycinase